jgi:1-acyl-sn-glycerol-3-phosphate acyltransferase
MRLSVARRVKRGMARAGLAVTGWRIDGQPPGREEVRIFVGAPHTSAWDTLLMLSVSWACDLQPRYLIKQEAFHTPLRWLWQLTGGIPVDRQNPGPLVADLAERSRRGAGFQLVLTPEGTRAPVPFWKSGFYRLAEASEIPLTLVSPDGPSRTVTFGPTFRVSGDVGADMARIREFLADKRGVVPSRVTVARLRAEGYPSGKGAPGSGPGGNDLGASAL